MNIFRGVISRQLVASMIVLAALGIFMGLVAYAQVQGIQAIITQTLAGADARYNRTRIHAESILLSDVTREYLQANPEERPRSRILVNESAQRLRFLLEQAIQNAAPEDRPVLERLDADIKAYAAHAKTLMETFDLEGGYGPRSQEAMATLLSHRAAMLDTIIALENAETNRLDQAQAQARQTAQTALRWIVGASVFIFILALLVSLANVRNILLPLTNIQRGVEVIAGGQLDHVLEIRRRDEFGWLAQAFNKMTGELRQLYSGLEQQAAARTAQLRAGAQVARAASSILDPQQLMQQVVDLICDEFGYYYAAIFLVDEPAAPGEMPYARLRAGRGEPGQIMLARDHKFERGVGMVGWVWAHQKARIALDVGQDAVRFANPLLPNTHSEIALPLQVGDRLLGVLDVQSERAAAFDENDIAVLQGMADQIAVALENARLFAQAQASLAQNEQLIAQIQTSLQETTALYAAGQSIALAQNTATVFQVIVENVLKPNIDLCMLVLFDPYETAEPQQLEITQAWWKETGQTADQAALVGMRFEFARFPLRAGLTADRPRLLHRREQPLDPVAQHMWDTLAVSTVVSVPLTVGARWIGALVLGAAGEDAFDEAELRPYQAIATQAATAIENQRLFERTQASLRELDTLYRSYMREAWTAALQARPTLTGYDYVRRTDISEAMPQTVLQVPLTLRGEEIGLLELEGGRRAWSDQERLLVEAIAAQTALALDSARLFDQTQRLAGRERLINEITARIRASTGVSDILQTAARELALALNVPHAVARLRVGEELQTENAERAAGSVEREA